MFSCSQCNFKSQFASALTMHRQLDHNAIEEVLKDGITSSNVDDYDNSKTYTKISCLNKNAVPIKGLSKTNSATRLFEKLRTKLCKSKAILITHPEENIKMDDVLNKTFVPNRDLPATSTVTAKPKTVSNNYIIEASIDIPTIKQLAKDMFRCHLCNFVADRITVLDRHLLNDHKIGLENLLKLVMAKTKDGIVNTEDKNIDTYYSLQNETFEDGEFIIQTLVPRILILKHAAVNTDLSWNDIPADRDEINNIEDVLANFDNNKIKMNLLDKMQNLDAYIHKLAESTDTLMKAQKKEMFDIKSEVDYRKNANIKEDLFNLGIGDRDNFYDWNDSRQRRGRLENLHQSNGYIKPKSASSTFHY